MVKGYIFLVVVYYLFGVLFLPDSICATGPYILGAFVFPVGVFALLYFLSVKFPNLFPAPDNTTPPAPSQKSPVPPAPPSPDSMFSDIDRMPVTPLSSGVLISSAPSVIQMLSSQRASAIRALIFSPQRTASATPSSASAIPLIWGITPSRRFMPASIIISATSVL